MAIDFTNPDSKTHLRRGNAVGNWDDVPISFFIQIKPTSSNLDSVDRKLVWLVNDPPGFGGYDKFGIGLTGSLSSDNKVFCTASHTSPHVTSYSSTAWFDDVDQWQSVGGTITGTVDGSGFFTTITTLVYHNGVAGTPATNSSGTFWLRNFENTYVGAGPTSVGGSYNGGFHGCWQNACVWVGAELTAQNFADLHDGDSPDTISAASLAMWAKGVDATTVVQQFGYSGGSVIQIADMTVNTGAGGYSTCADTPSGPAASGIFRTYNRIFG